MLVCPQCTNVRPTQFSGNGDGDICESHGWIDAIKVVPAETMEKILSITMDSSRTDRDQLTAINLLVYEALHVS